MWYFQRIDPHTLFHKRKYISFVGAGGKTSFIEYLARDALKAGMRVAITTTTRIWATEPFVTVEQGGMEWAKGEEQLVRIGKTVEKGKLTGLDFSEVEALGEEFDLVLVEADGAKGCPLKYPSAYEPVIPPFSERVVVVAGLDGLSGTVAEKVFRWELFRRATGAGGETKVDSAVFQRLFREDALMKGVDAAKCMVVLNKYDACCERGKVPELARAVSEVTRADQVVIASVRLGVFYGILLP